MAENETLVRTWENMDISELILMWGMQKNIHCGWHAAATYLYYSRAGAVCHDRIKMIGKLMSFRNVYCIVPT